MKKLWEKLKKEFFVAETLRYLIIGLCTTFCTLLGAFVFKKIFAASSIPFFRDNFAMLSTAAGCLIAAIVAFFGNKIYVFKSKSWKPLVIIKEFFGTLGSRAFSFVMLTIGMGFFVDRDVFHFVPFAQKHFGWDEHFAHEVVLFWAFRLILGGLEVVFNYLINKLILFRKKRLQAENPTEENEEVAQPQAEE
ncbi:MAG: hypothetical protein IJJ41_04755 [Clostridia bacterium]|nr:hypothetical protein [Clostridia bacterium]